MYLDAESLMCNQAAVSCWLPGPCEQQGLIQGPLSPVYVIGKWKVFAMLLSVACNDRHLQKA